jgi:hypothetical protein
MHCCILLDYFYVSYTMMHGSRNIKFKLSYNGIRELYVGKQKENLSSQPLALSSQNFRNIRLADSLASSLEK